MKINIYNQPNISAITIYILQFYKQKTKIDIYN